MTQKQLGGDTNGKLEVKDIVLEDVKDEYKVVERKPGQVAKATITRCGQTTWRGLGLNEDQLKRFTAPDQKILFLEAVTEDGQRLNDKITLPETGKTTSENSRLGKFIRAYGQPKEGLQVNVIVDGNKYWKILA